MSNPTRSYTVEEMVSQFHKSGDKLIQAAAAVGCSASTMKRYLVEAGIDTSGKSVKQQPLPAITLPEFPDDDISVEEIRESMVKRFEKRSAHHKAKEWFRIKVNIDGPIGLTFWGDPHVDDDGCNWPLLNHHCELHAKNPALFSVNIGDTINNWSGRLARLFADQETSNKTARKLARWYLTDSGVRWLAWLMGNHDLWTDFPEYLRAHNVNRVPMEDWQARFRLTFPKGREVKIWASHDFKGNSMWNSLHSLQKAAHTKSEAHIYAAGHTHNWAIHQEESASRDFTYWLIRSRGYKFIDHFAENLGHMPQSEGASITCIIRPEARSESGLIQAFADMDAANDYLKFLRR